jgi:CRP/FNR family cyclic AMP-dependent transcriptional regulator
MDLSLSYVFKGLSDDQLERIETIAKELSIEAGQEIIKEGEEAKAVYILKSGAVELVTMFENDFELPISILREPGDIFGAGVLVAPYKYTLTARCFNTGVLLKFEKSALQQLMKEDRDLSCIMMSNLAEYFLLRLKESRREIKIHFSTLLKTYR